MSLLEHHDMAMSVGATWYKKVLIEQLDMVMSVGAVWYGVVAAVVW